ncbi:hypothetical protein [Solibacillus sp. FSL W8-0372]|uniref:hypothetical protein n=1 Tax=Solibacillus sp. FSL W8-0372 TaxID=2921713 RepID=UPI0030D3404A
MNKGSGKNMLLTPPKRPNKKKALSSRQQKRIELLSSLAGSIKTPYEVDAVETVNELRGKTDHDYHK